MTGAASSGLITTADIFDALTAERPYRAAMPITKALAIMAEMVGTQIDAKCFDALTRSLARTDANLVA
jgi:HD-GYP domain-containing protein (c-di-GMP phosphodiesterase class II)